MNGVVVCGNFYIWIPVFLDETCYQKSNKK